MKKSYVKLPAELFTTPKAFGIKEIRALGYLATLGNGWHRVGYKEWIAIGIDSAGISKTMMELEKKGLIEIHRPDRERGNPVEYRVLFNA